MALLRKESLKNTLNRIVKASSTFRAVAENANQDLVDSVYCTVTSPQAVTLGSTSTAIPALTIPANCIIVDAGVIVTTAIAMSSGTVGTKIGTAADGAQLSAAAAASIATTGTSVDAGKGTAIIASTQASLAGNAAIALVGGQGYRSAETEVHFTITSTAAVTAGAVKCYVKFQELA